MTTIERSGLIPHTDMPNTLRTARVRTVLSRLFAGAAHKRPNTVIEFATSYGISIIDLAAAVADNALGRVVTTELSETKGLAARANLGEGCLADRATILLGDAMTAIWRMHANRPTDTFRLHFPWQTVGK